MQFAVLKLADIAARSLFVLLALFALPTRSAGQFGLLLTLIGLFSFGVGFERYLDVQRRAVGSSPEWTDRLILSLLRFSAINYAIGLPLLLALLVLWVDLSLIEVVLCVLIAVSEHISSEVYRLSLTVKRHRPLLLPVLCKNLLTLALVVEILWFRPGSLNLNTVLQIWACTSGLCLVAIVIGFMRTWAFAGVSQCGDAALGQAEQYQASLVHFIIGSLAMAALQADRLIAAALLSLEESGLYFRHIFVAAFAYQIFNVVSYNRIAPRVYEMVRSNEMTSAWSAIHAEIRKVIVSAIVLVLLYYSAIAAKIPLSDSFNTLNAYYLSILTLGFLIRSFADFNALVLNATFLERYMLTSQGISVAVAIVLNIILTLEYGIVGTMSTLAIGSAVYYFFSRHYVRKATRAKQASSM